MDRPILCSHRCKYREHPGPEDRAKYVRALPSFGRKMPRTTLGTGTYGTGAADKTPGGAEGYINGVRARHPREALRNYHPPVKTGGIEIGKVKDHQLKLAALKLEEYKR